MLLEENKDKLKRLEDELINAWPEKDSPFSYEQAEKLPYLVSEHPTFVAYVNVGYRQLLSRNLSELASVYRSLFRVSSRRRQSSTVFMSPPGYVSLYSNGR